MKSRSFISLGTAFSGIIIVITGIMLFLKGSVLEDYMKVIHEWLSLIFTVFLVVHVFYNIKPMAKYLKGAWFGVSKEAVINFAVVVALTTLISANVDDHKKGREELDENYPKIENIELSRLLEYEKVNFENAIQKLEEKGYTVPADTLTLNNLAKVNKTHPKVLYSVMVAN